MACQRDSLRGVLADEADLRARQKAADAARAMHLHKLGESNTVIARRLGVSIPTVVKYLRGQGSDGYSVNESEGIRLPARARPATVAARKPKSPPCPAPVPVPQGPVVWTQLALLEVAPCPRPPRVAPKPGECRTVRRASPRPRQVQESFAFLTEVPVRQMSTAQEGHGA
ncbi:hypothetical protein [Myxococcus sp. AS-1-15]|uniref:hypothetical protein n=1 Tax=Myxococcus sp. AS-1-15 TaxID=2874600 RepID=UPI001CBB84BB|nr:hypothetical protein [Myxococcus sp. AS-1-15]MBZ4400407.1 hypothetical protein [Myxococcus sp. AS-1-15]